jgi:hypothetical protein
MDGIGDQHAKRSNPVSERHMSCFSLICGTYRGKVHESKRGTIMNVGMQKGKGERKG